MGRGLSNLQRFIMEKVAQEGDIAPPDILQGFFGWKTARSPRQPGGNRFSPREMGMDRYHKTMVTLSRSIRRLEFRGLLQRAEPLWGNRFRLRLTDKGRCWVLRTRNGNVEIPSPCG